jgi:heme oxygenase
MHNLRHPMTLMMSLNASWSSTINRSAAAASYVQLLAIIRIMPDHPMTLITHLDVARPGAGINHSMMQLLLSGQRCWARTFFADLISVWE